jgi:hypothetical protein
LTTLLTGLILAQTGVSYEGKIELPVDLHSGDGLLLEKGKFDLEVRFEKGHYSLAFLRNGKIVVLVNGRSLTNEDKESPPTIPVVGTVFLRSTAEPIGTEEERHYVKTGRPQYAEQTRDWKATLRVYKATNPSSKVHFIFQERAERGEWTRTEFILFFTDGSEVTRKSP